MQLFHTAIPKLKEHAVQWALKNPGLLGSRRVRRDKDATTPSESSDEEESLPSDHSTEDEAD